MSESLFPNFLRGLDSAIPTAKKDGAFRITTDTQRLFIEIDGARIEITDFIKKTEMEIKSILAPLGNKFYFATDTNKIYYYHGGKWNTVGGTGTVTATVSGTLTKTIDVPFADIISYHENGVDVVVNYLGTILYLTYIDSSVAHFRSVELEGSDGFIYGSCVIIHNDNTVECSQQEYRLIPFQGATSSAEGYSGVVPSPNAGDQDKFLRGDGTWAEVSTGSTAMVIGTRLIFDGVKAM